MSVSAIPTQTDGPVGNPKRVRGLAAAPAEPSVEPESTLVGNPRRVRGLPAEDVKAV